MFPHQTWMTAVIVQYFSPSLTVRASSPIKKPIVLFSGGGEQIFSDTVAGRRPATYVLRFARCDHLTLRHLTLSYGEVI
jgi:hypothetical protein